MFTVYYLSFFNLNAYMKFFYLHRSGSKKFLKVLHKWHQTTVNLKYQDFLDLKSKIFKTFEIQFKIWDLRLYYSMVFTRFILSNTKYYYKYEFHF